MTPSLRGLLKWLAEPVMVVAAMLFATTAIAQPFYVPSGSMEPTLRIGDAMIASKYAYGYSTASLPFLDRADPGSARLLGSMPKQGDVVIFRLSQAPYTVLVKRLVGMPGDRIQMVHGRLTINGRTLALADAGIGEVEGTDGEQMAVQQFTETLPNGVRHPIYKWRWDGVMDDTAAVTVPAGHLFMMGDNRDNSRDSRVSVEDGGVGFVPVSNLMARAEFVAASYDFRNMRGVTSWPGLVRASRFFQKIL